MLQWILEEKRARKKGTKPAERGRRPAGEQIRFLVLKMARENSWGYARIVDELKKLGIRSLSKSTVRHTSFKVEGLDPVSRRRAPPGDEFLKRHAASLSQCDFSARRC